MIDRDGLRSSVIFDGTRGWSVDASGLVSELDGAALAQERTAALLRTAELPTHAAGAITLLPDGRLQLGDEFPATVTFDPATHLPASYERVVNGSVEKTELSDWRAVEGTHLPFARKVTGDDVTTVAITSVDHAACDFRPPADRTDDVHLAEPLVVALYIDPHAEIHVRATIGSTDAAFILDTGAPSLLDPDRLPGAALTVTQGDIISTTHGIDRSGFAHDVSFTIGGARLGPYTLRTVSMASTYPTVDAGVAGLIGTELFQRVTAEIDYPAGFLRLHDRATYQHAPGTPIPFTLSDREPVIEATLTTPTGPVHGHFLVDTGCQCEVLLSAAYTGSHEVSAIDIGGTHITGARVVAMPRDSKAIFANQELAGYIGGLLLRRYRVTFDYARRQMWLD